MSDDRYHIAHVLPFPSLGGTEMSTLRIAQCVPSTEFRHTAFCLPEAELPRRLFAEAGYETALFTGVQPSYRHPNAYLTAAWQLARELRKRRVSLLHCADVLAAHFTALAGKLARVPVLCHVRNRHQHITRRDQSFLIPVDRFVFVSRDTWRRFALKVEPARGALVYDGVTVQPLDQVTAGAEVRKEFGIPSHVKIIGMVARIAPQKDYETLARAAARVIAVQPDVRFMLVGDYSQSGHNRDHYEKVTALLEEMKLTPWFIFTGHRTDVAHFLAAFDLFVLCTHTEGFGLVLLEAMAQSRPVIATDVDGTPEIVLDGQTGLLHPHEDDAALAAQILSLLQDEARAAQLGEAGYAFACANFSQQRFTAAMTRQYHKMLRGNQTNKGDELK